MFSCDAGGWLAGCLYASTEEASCAYLIYPHHQREIERGGKEREKGKGREARLKNIMMGSYKELS
jgi:hypothetical protein